MLAFRKAVDPASDLLYFQSLILLLARRAVDLEERLHSASELAHAPVQDSRS